MQRTFTVDLGSVRFYGDVEKGGLLDVSASSTVRQANRQGEDVKILAHITGTTNDPRPELSSGERYALSEPEILSYLIFGQPSFVQGRIRRAAPPRRCLLPSVGTASSALSRANSTGWTRSRSSRRDDAAERPVQRALRFTVRRRKAAGRQDIRRGERRPVLPAELRDQRDQLLAVAGPVGRAAPGRQVRAAGVARAASAAMLCKPGTTDIGSRPAQYGIDLFREWTF